MICEYNSNFVVSGYSDFIFQTRLWKLLCIFHTEVFNLINDECQCIVSFWVETKLWCIDVINTYLCLQNKVAVSQGSSHQL